MKIRIFLVVMLVAFSSLAVVAQKKAATEKDEYDENYEFRDTQNVNLNIGFGLGLDYGGIGGRLTVVPTPHVGIFGALGYNLNGAGYNIGVTGRILPNSRVCPYGALMYGYNGVIIITGMSDRTKTYYGVSLAGGIELKTRNGRFWNFELVVPFRSSQYHDDVKAVMNDPNIENFTEAFPIGFSVGYHLPL